MYDRDTEAIVAKLTFVSRVPFHYGTTGRRRSESIDVSGCEFRIFAAFHIPSHLLNCEKIFVFPRNTVCDYSVVEKVELFSRVIELKVHGFGFCRR